jgi:hypothetical protein
MTEVATPDDRDDERQWIVSVTTNMSMDDRDLDDETEVIENADGTTTYVKRREVPPPTDR